jgi:hypothetical protein
VIDRRLSCIHPDFLVESGRLRAAAEAYTCIDGSTTFETSLGPICLEVRPSYAYAHFGEWGDEPSSNGAREDRGLVCALAFEKKWREP